MPTRTNTTTAKSKAPSKSVRKAPKTRKNQPLTFQEALTPALLFPAAPALPALPRLTSRQARAGLIIVWAIAVVAAGAGLGLLLRGHTAAVLPPEPIATANLTVTPASTTPIVGIVHTSMPKLAITPASSVNQAQTGQPFATASTTTYQPATNPLSLQPGYKPVVPAQGTRGTDPVE